MKTIFVIQGYERKREDGTLEEVVVYEVYAKTGKEAIDKAKKYYKKSFYRISQIVEK